MACWLFKSEPSVYSIDDLRRERRTFWDGVRNYQARNFLRDAIAVGDDVLFYHSNAQPPAVAGLARVVKAGSPDATALDPKHDHYDPKSSRENPIWYGVDIAFVEEFENPPSLETLRGVTGLAKMALLQKGSRLSIQPVTPAECRIVLALARG